MIDVYFFYIFVADFFNPQKICVGGKNFMEGVAS